LLAQKFAGSLCLGMQIPLFSARLKYTAEFLLKIFPPLFIAEANENKLLLLTTKILNSLKNKWCVSIQQKRKLVIYKEKRARRQTVKFEVIK
jgi:hypothetical protein